MAKATDTRRAGQGPRTLEEPEGTDLPITTAAQANNRTVRPAPPLEPFTLDPKCPGCGQGRPVLRTSYHDEGVTAERAAESGETCVGIEGPHLHLTCSQPPGCGAQWHMETRKAASVAGRI